VLTCPKTGREEFVKVINSNNIGKTRRAWDIRDYSFWNQFGIPMATLNKYNVEPISYLHVGSERKIIRVGFHTYCYNEFKDGEQTFKIYQPDNADYKWINNHNDSVWQGWAQLPKEGEKLIITKSLKDVMAIDAITGIPAVSLQSETTNPKEHIIQELYSRFPFVLK